MKRCPNCNQHFSDENLYCLSDGTHLVSDAPDVPTIVTRQPIVQQSVQPVRQGVSPLFAYVAVALFALIIGGAIVAYLKSDSKTPTDSISTDVSTQQKSEPPTIIQQKNEKPTVVSNPVVQPTVVVKESVKNNRTEISQYPDSKPQQLTAEVVRNLLVAWEKAQDNRKFSTYQSCYDSSFVGVKTTSDGNSQNLNYRIWMIDRRRIFSNAVNLDVDISNLQIRVEGDTAIAEFDQYYRSLRYSDWGPKEIRVKMTPSGAKIVYEVLKASYPL